MSRRLAIIAVVAARAVVASAGDAPPAQGAPTVTPPTTPAVPVAPTTPASPAAPTTPTPPAAPTTPATTGPSSGTASPAGPSSESSSPTTPATPSTAATPSASGDLSASTTAPAPEAPPDLSDQAIGAEIGAASGGRDTPGGLRIAGHYLYQLAAQDWFDGLAAFTFGGGSAACFRDRMNVYLCNHGIADGGSIEIAATVRHFFGPSTVRGTSGQFWPFVLGGVGVRVDRFSADDVTGLAIPLHVGAGLRVSVTSSVAITAQGQLEIGFGAFNHTLGLEPQFGAALTAGAEFRL